MVHRVRDVGTAIPDVSRLRVMCGREWMCCGGGGPTTVVGHRCIRRLRFVRWGVEARNGRETRRADCRVEGCTRSE
eukprot:scaffold28139_cov151-Isochrysis_galbana.AAC.1